MYTIITIISYTSLLLLIMPATTSGILLSGLLWLLGSAFFLWKKPQLVGQKQNIPSLLIGAGIAGYLGCDFYEQWIYSSKVQMIAEILHIPNQVLVIVTPIVLALFAALFIAGFVRKIYRAPLFWGAMATIALSQLMIGANVFSMGLGKFLLGAGIVFLPVMLLYCICRKQSLSILLGTLPFMVISTANAYVYQFRGRLFEPVDIFSVRTAMNVAENYSLWPIPARVVFCWAIWTVLLFLLFRLNVWKKPLIAGKRRAVIALCCLAGMCALFFCVSNLKAYHWDKEGATFNGYILDFVAKIKEVRVEKPEGYDTGHIDAQAAQYGADESPTETKTPHIIVIMDESFSDLGVNGALHTDKEVTPFISSLSENTISGYALASIHGGNTANSEYEFLTGNSMAWMSPNAVPYQTYVRSSAYSMVSYLKTRYNYQCIAMHPYLSSGWNRPVTYANFGFDESLFIESFPQEQYVRKYISDQEMFESMIEVYENHKDSPLFLFGVSMQNHGGYTYDGENYEQTISLVGYDGEYPDVEQYLSLIHETDRAMEYLLSYFEQVDEDVVIAFFGDHQPRIDENFYGQLNGADTSALDEQQKRYLVPFFVWANYDIDEQYVDCTSLNYLSSYVYETAGISLPPYQRFLSDMAEHIPAINANGYYSKTTGGFVAPEDAPEDEKEWLRLYEQLQYNCVFDKQRNETLFPTLS